MREGDVKPMKPVELWGSWVSGLQRSPLLCAGRYSNARSTNLPETLAIGRGSWACRENSRWVAWVLLTRGRNGLWWKVRSGSDRYHTGCLWRACDARVDLRLLGVGAHGNEPFSPVPLRGCREVQPLLPSEAS